MTQKTFKVLPLTLLRSNMIITLPSGIQQGAILKFNNRFIMDVKNCTCLQPQKIKSHFHITQCYPQQRRTALIRSIYKQNRHTPIEQHVNYKAAFQASHFPV